MPNLSLWRPADAVETAVAWAMAVGRTSGPTALVLTRQALPQQPKTAAQGQAIARGGYTLIEPAGGPEAIVIATGSEVGLAATAVNALNAEGRRVRLVSMPSTDTFDRQDAAYRETVLPPSITRRVAVEAGATLSVEVRGQHGRVLGIDSFGASAGLRPFRHFVFTRRMSADGARSSLKSTGQQGRDVMAIKVDQTLRRIAATSWRAVRVEAHQEIQIVALNDLGDPSPMHT